MKIKTFELTGAALDWAVASYADKHVTVGDIAWGNYSPSTAWALGGPIIEREKITVSQGRDLIASIWSPDGILGNDDWYRYKSKGPTPLIAAMRCYVASKLGDEVEVPDELC